MTLEEKVWKLYHSYRSLEGKWGDKVMYNYDAKQCALIAVEFARDQFRDHCCAEIDIIGSPDDHFDLIKQEIQKL